MSQAEWNRVVAMMEQVKQHAALLKALEEAVQDMSVSLAKLSEIPARNDMDAKVADLWERVRDLEETRHKR